MSPSSVAADPPSDASPKPCPHPSGHPTPAVSVIVVNYNAGPLLAECARALLASTVSVELIVSDNGSQDDSLARLEAVAGSDPRLRVLRNGANLGFARANNLALPLTRADHLLLLNPDCMIGPDTLARMLEALAARPGVGLAGCIVRDPDGREQAASRRGIPDPWTSLIRLLGLERWVARGARLYHHGEPLPTGPVAVEAVSGSFMWVRRRALDDVGPLDEGYFLHCEDLDWFVRYRQAGWEILLVPDVSVVHHKGACSTGDPLAVERHKHRGMARFYSKFQAGRYPRPFGWLVVTGIWAHFGLLTIRHRLRGLLSRAPRRPDPTSGPTSGAV